MRERARAAVIVHDGKRRAGHRVGAAQPLGQPLAERGLARAQTARERDQRPGGQRLASSRPTATVSSREWVTNSCISKLLVLGRIRRGHIRIYYSTEIRICKI